MALWILAAMVGALVFGYSILPVIVIGTIAMTAVAFFLTRNKRIAVIGLVFGTLVFNHLVIQEFSKMPRTMELPPWAMWLGSDGMLEACACITMVVIMFFGIFGSIQDLPLTMEGMVKTVEDHDNEGGSDNKG